VFPNTIEIRATETSGEERERRIAKTSSTPGSVSTMIFCAIFVGIVGVMRVSILR